MNTEKQTKKFNGLSLTSIILSYFALMSTFLGFIFMESEEMIFAAVLSLLICIPAFILQFKARNYDLFIVWKILSFVSLGLCILTFVIIFLLLILAVVLW